MSGSSHSLPGREVDGFLGRIVSSRLSMQMIAAITMLSVLIYGTASFPVSAHVSLSLLAIAMAIAITRVWPEYRLVSVLLSAAISLRYILWRGLETLNLDAGPAQAAVSVLLFVAEAYTVFVLIGGYFQTSVLLDRKPAPIQLRADSSPSVDVFITTYNEPIDIVRRTAVAALAMDYANKKVYLLDDGRRADIKALAAEVGAGYITRADNRDAKAGNINHAMSHTRGEYIAFFDADHAPVRSFLQVTVGFFLQNANLAIVQTPHHFYNADPFARNLYTDNHVPPEHNLFYHLVQVSNDFWNSAFFCGSCGVLRRTAIDDVGGMATETVTEDAHTSLKMQAMGWDSAYLNIPQAAGLATETFGAYVGQRIRWTRGMAQMMRLDTPLFKRGLTWFQRLNYTFAASHFFFGLPRMVFMLAPVAYLIFRLNPLDQDVMLVLMYAVPHLALAYINASAAHGNQRHTFWPEVYETAMAPWSAAVTLSALIAPRRGTFNVTPKGAQSDRTQLDVGVAWPLLLLLFLCLAGMGGFFLHYQAYPAERSTLWVALAWNTYNMVLLSAAIAAAIDRPQRRRQHRIPVTHNVLLVERNPSVDQGGVDDPEDEPSFADVPEFEAIEVYYDQANVLIPDDEENTHNTEASLDERSVYSPSLLPEPSEIDGDLWRSPAQTLDLSEAGARLLLAPGTQCKRHVRLIVVDENGQRMSFAAEVLASWDTPKGVVARARFLHLQDAQVHQLIRLMFCDPNAWTHRSYRPDKPTAAFISILTAPIRAVWYAMSRQPAEQAPLSGAQGQIHRPVLLCPRCQGVLLRPQPTCPHCDMSRERTLKADIAAYAGPFERARRRALRPPTVWSYVVPLALAAVSLVIATGWRPPALQGPTLQGVAAAHHDAALAGRQLSTQLLDAVDDGDRVPPEWGSRVAERRAQYPSPEAPHPPRYTGPEAEELGQLFATLHELESEYRRQGTSAPDSIRRLRDAFRGLK